MVLDILSKRKTAKIDSKFTNASFNMLTSCSPGEIYGRGYQRNFLNIFIIDSNPLSE